MARARVIAAQALDDARVEGDPARLAAALRARHDVEWAPGTAPERLAVLGELEALVGPDDLQLRLLRAQALLELGDPASVVLVDGSSTKRSSPAGRPRSGWPHRVGRRRRC